VHTLILLSLLNMSTASAAPKNIFLFVADGAGYNTFAAASMFQGRWDPQTQTPAGQVYGSSDWIQVGKSCWSLAEGPNEEADPSRAYSSRAAWRAGGASGATESWSGQRYPYAHGTVSWHAETHPDSAATMSQMMTGVKTYNGAINVGIDGQPRAAFAELIHEERGVGVVSSVPLSHATPAAAAAAHNPSRRAYAEIAQEILSAGVVDVWMGAGHPLYDDDGLPRGEVSFRYIGGAAAWASLYDGEAGWGFIDQREDFEALARGEGEPEGRLLGLAPVSSSLQVNRSGTGSQARPGDVPLVETVPSLHTMAQGAVHHLSATQPGGFFLMVEGGAVDWAMHGNAAGHMIEEMIAFNEAIEGVVGWIEENGGWEDNLVIITADHDHLFQGVPTKRDPFPWVDDRGEGKVPGYTWLWNNHSNHLVPVFARGAGADALLALADERDPRRGPYIEDTEVFDTLLRAWSVPDPR